MQPSASASSHSLSDAQATDAEYENTASWKKQRQVELRFLLQSRYNFLI